MWRPHTPVITGLILVVVRSVMSFMNHREVSTCVGADVGRMSLQSLRTCQCVTVGSFATELGRFLRARVGSEVGVHCSVANTSLDVQKPI